MTGRHIAIGLLLVATLPNTPTAAPLGGSAALFVHEISQSPASQPSVRYGSVAGTVTDPTGSPVVGAFVVLTNMTNGLKRETVTNGEGQFRIIDLQPGTHILGITKGTVYVEFRQVLSVTRGNVTRSDARLQAGTPENAANLLESLRRQTTVRPFVKLEKPRFAVGEQVFFWVGVSAGAIPLILCDTGRVLITRPDGTERVDRSGCPIDGRVGAGWQGGRSLGSEVPQVGQWVVAYEFAGHRSEPASFIVARDDIVGQIDATFVFSSPLVLDSPEAFVTLIVRNRSPETIRFPERGLSHLVSGRLSRTSGEGWARDFFVREAVLLSAAGSVRPRIASDPFTWNLADQVPTVSVLPGGTYELRLPLAAALDSGTGGLATIPAGEYEVRLYTLLQTLAGSPDGQWKDLSPLRIQVTETARAIRR
jgi:hypothetical protein